jgi:uridine kinase
VGRPVPLPVYDFATYTRRPETVTVEPASVILVDGILIFAEPELRGLMDIKVFVDTDADIRLIRRIQRDTRERGRTLSSVVFQYLDTVRPMDLEFVQPSRRYADIIIPGGGQNRVAIEMGVSRLQAILPA